MMVDKHHMELIRQHKRWCDKYVLFSIGAILALFIATSVVMDYLGLAAASRPGIYIMLATIILATVIWNAVAMGIEEMHAFMDDRKTK